MSQDERERIYVKQRRVIMLAKQLGLETDVPISEVQIEAPTVAELEQSLYPEFETSMNAFLEHFGQ